MREKIKQIFSGKNGRLSSKRIIGTILIVIAMVMYIHSYFSGMELNTAAFNTVLYTGGIMIVGGVLEKG